MYSAREQLPERDQAFWTTHFRQNGYKRPGQRQRRQQQQQLSDSHHHGSSSSNSRNNNGRTHNSHAAGKVLLSPSTLHLFSPHHPRPFDHIESERQHLQYLLSEEDGRARDLFTRIAAVDEAYAFGSLPEHRQARKDRAWLRRCIDQAVGREKEILARLGEIHVEIQCRERWYMVEQQKAFLSQKQQHPQQQEQQPHGWDGKSPFDQPRWQRRGSAVSGYHHCGLESTTAAGTYAQQQHILSVNYYPSMAELWTNVSEWYPDFVTPAAAGIDWRRRRISEVQYAGSMQPFSEEKPAYRSTRRSSYQSNSSYAAGEVGGQHGPPHDSRRPGSHLPDRRRSLPTMHYNWDEGGIGGDSGHQCLGYIAEE